MINGKRKIELLVKRKNDYRNNIKFKLPVFLAASMILLGGAITVGLFEFSSESPPVSYLGEDWDTKGDWVGVYGHYAYILPKAPRSGWEYPIGTPDSEEPTAPYFDYVGGDGWPVDYTLTGPVVTNTPDVRALEKPDESARRATCYWADSTITLNVPCGNYQLGLYLMDWDSYARVITLTITDSTGTVTQSVSNFHNGVYELFLINGGTVTISLTKTGGSNAVISGVFIDSTTLTGNIQYLGSDTVTQGDWVGNYGGQWYLLCAMDSIYTWSNTQPEDPAYDIKGGVLSVTYTVSNGNYWAWTDYLTSGTVIKPTYAYNWQDISTDVRACWFTQDHVFNGYPTMVEMVHREATCWDSHTDSHFLVTLSIPDGNFYLSLYALDFDTTVRSQTIEIFDSEGTLLETVTVSNFNQGVYERFAVQGPIDLTIKVTKITGANSVLSGIFLDRLGTCSDGRTIGFWKTNVAKNLGYNKGKAQVSGSNIENFLSVIGNQYGTDFTFLNGLDLVGAYDVLRILDASIMKDKAEAQILALLLTAEYKGDDYKYAYVTLPEYSGGMLGAIDYILELYENGDYEAAKDLADTINNID